VWERVAYVLQSEPQTIRSAGAEIRRHVPNDGKLLEEIHEEMHSIWNTWGDPDGLASSGYAWEAFVDGRLVSIAYSFFVGENYEELGVVTSPDHRRKGLSAACTVGLREDILARGKQPSWSTSPENYSSLSVAEKVGFTFMNNSRLYVIGIPIPEEN